VENPYQAPSSRVGDVRPAGAAEPVGRGVRFGAVIIDRLIQSVIIVGCESYLGIYRQAIDAAKAGQMLPLDVMLTVLAINVAVVVLLQGYPLVTWGQTWGKRACSIKIVDLADRKPSIARLAVRYAVILSPVVMSFLGSVFAIVDDCFIFREDRRCIHDLAAGTRVVNA